MTDEQIIAIKKAARYVSNPKFGTGAGFASESDRREWLDDLKALKEALQPSEQQEAA